MHPPQLLIPFELLRRTALAIHKVEDTAVLLIPTEFERIQTDLNSLANQLLVATTTCQIHHKPHRFERMTGVDQSAVERVAQRAIGVHMLNDQTQFRTIEVIHHIAQRLLDRLLNQFRLNQMLDFEQQVAENHRRSQRTHIARACVSLVPTSFGVIPTLHNVLERATCNLGIALLARRLMQLRKGHRRKGIGEDVVGINQRLTIARECEIPIVIAIVAISEHKLCTLTSALQPLRTHTLLVAHHREEPHLTTLQPHKFVGIEDRSVAVEAGEITTKLLILRVFQPERQYSIMKFVVILLDQCIYIFHRISFVKIILQLGLFSLRSRLQLLVQEIEEDNRVGKTKDLIKKIGDTKGTFLTKMDTIKDRNGKDITEAEKIKKRWQEYTEDPLKKMVLMTWITT